MLEENEKFLTLKIIANKLGLGTSTLSKKLQHSAIRKFFKGKKMFIPATEIPKIKELIFYNDEFDKGQYYPTNEVAKLISKEIPNVNRTNVNNWIKQGKVKSILHLNYRYIEVNDVKNLMELLKNQYHVPEGYCSIEEASKFLDMHPASIKEWVSNKDIQSLLVISDGLWRTFVKKNQLLRVRNEKIKQVNKVLMNADIELFPEKIPEYEQLKKERLVLEKDNKFISIAKASEILGISIASVKLRIKNKQDFPNTKRILNTTFINKIDLDNFRKKNYKVPKGYLSYRELEVEFGINSSRLLVLRKKGLLSDVKIIKRKIYFNQKEVQSLLENNNEEQRRLLNREKRKRAKESVPEDYISKKEMSKLLGVTISQTSRLCKEGILESVKINNKIYISKKEQSKYLTYKEQQKELQTIEQVNKIPEGYLDVNDSSKFLNISTATCRGYIKKGELSEVLRVGRKIYILQKNLESFSQFRKSEKKIGITKYEIIQDIKKNFIVKDYKESIKMNILLFQKFSEVKINATNGRVGNLRRVYSQLRKLFQDIVIHIEVDITELEGEFIEKVLVDGKYSNPTREHFLNYIKYAYINSGKKMNKEYVLSRKNKLDTKDVNTERYSVKEYESFIYLVKDIERHLNKAIGSREYANMWVLVTMLLTTAWRPSDIICEIPRIDINTIGISNPNWFNKHKLTKEQCHLILQQLHLLLGNSVTSKTSKPLRLLVSPDMVEPLIYSIVISELHAKAGDVAGEKTQKLLGSFLTGIIKEPKTSGRKKHLKFLESINMEQDFQSSKLHNSTMTYLFLDISEEQEFSELSIETIGWMRSHADINTTATYIKLVNKDGTLDRVSVNLFKRGHFGWLYNYMIHLAYSNLKLSQTMEQRTNTILDLRNEFSPLEIEQWAKVLGDFDSRKNNIIRQLSSMDEIQLKDLLLKVFKCKMPSRDGYGQCIVYSNCKYRSKKTCIGCEYFIPQFSEIFLEAKREFYRLVNSIEVARTENILVRDSRLLLNVLMLFNEAVNSFGIETINSYLNLEERANSIKRISTKLRF